MERLDVLPVLLQEGHKEVDAQHDISQHLVLSHLDVSYGNAQAQNFLQLELYRAPDLGELVVEIFRVGDRSRELAGLGQTGSEQTGDLTNERLRRKEGVVFLGEFLNELLVLVELLQVVNRHVLKLNLFRAINVGRISENADRHARTRDIRELDSTRETLVALRVVVLQPNLKLDRLDKVALLLAVGIGQQLLDGASHA